MSSLPGYKEKMVRAFTAALEHLSDTSYHVKKGKAAYICYAICNAQAAGKITQLESVAARELIIRRLNYCGSFQGWLSEQFDTDTVEEANFYLDFNHDRLRNKGRRLQDTRRAWLESLVEEFSR